MQWNQYVATIHMQQLYQGLGRKMIYMHSIVWYFFQVAHNIGVIHKLRHMLCSKNYVTRHKDVERSKVKIIKSYHVIYGQLLVGRESLKILTIGLYGNLQFIILSQPLDVTVYCVLCVWLLCTAIKYILYHRLHVEHLCATGAFVLYLMAMVHS